MADLIFFEAQAEEEYVGMKGSGAESIFIEVKISRGGIPSGIFRFNESFPFFV